MVIHLEMAEAQSIFMPNHRVGARVTFTSNSFLSINEEFSARFDLLMSRKSRQVYVLLISRFHCFVASLSVGSKVFDFYGSFIDRKIYFHCRCRFVQFNLMLKRLQNLLSLKRKSLAKLSA